MDTEVEGKQCEDTRRVGIMKSFSSGRCCTSEGRNRCPWISTKNDGQNSASHFGRLSGFSFHNFNRRLLLTFHNWHLISATFLQWFLRTQIMLSSFHQDMGRILTLFPFIPARCTNIIISTRITAPPKFIHLNLILVNITIPSLLIKLRIPRLRYFDQFVPPNKHPFPAL